MLGGYATLGTNDLPKAIAFYNELFGLFGAMQIRNDERMALWTTEAGAVLGVCLPFNGEAASAGNGTMMGLNAGSKENVDKVHALALSLGGSDEGAPGPRGDGAAYSGYFRDLDGNKLVVYHFG
ncbi:MAG: VOC family protein [Alphaproteobacteria bacterium]